MIKIENFEIVGWEHAIRGMRNPKNSWEKSDSFECVHDIPAYAECDECPFKSVNEYGSICVRPDKYCAIGSNDMELMNKLAAGGPVHAKYRRMITVYMDITAPLYWWKEFDTYKVGTVANSCSTMHKIHDKEFTLEDFSHEHIDIFEEDGEIICDFKDTLELIIDDLNRARKLFLETKNKPMKDEAAREALMKKYWWQMIQLLPSSYNQKRTVMLNYEVLAGIYKWRKNHKLNEWREFCEWIETLPYSELITGGVENG